ncbi:hypothetical protein GCM10011578_091320 [Streptomyces fuscichromogenes]|uniref:Uncharacterized protein n=1 Tax=Streptomyces fuscichromogenes TaxID=1324013 RepID=A0A918CWX2_9ACTN|nr:hypothetical protein GCM10011578_091320 [Streptomyces fuscichromogenes]
MTVPEYSSPVKQVTNEGVSAIGRSDREDEVTSAADTYVEYVEGEAPPPPARVSNTCLPDPSGGRRRTARPVSAFEELPEVMPRLASGELSALCHRIRCSD